VAGGVGGIGELYRANEERHKLGSLACAT